jgi:hypothetical protein
MNNPIRGLIATMTGAACCLAMFSNALLWGADAGGLRIGVAKVDITPERLVKVNPNDFGDFVGVHDPIFARALIIDDGSNTVALVSLDNNQLGGTLPVRARIQQELGIQANHIILASSHDHSAPMLGNQTPGSLAKSGGPEVDAYTSMVNDKIVAALKQAKASLRPARLGLGTGHADVNVNRDVYTPQGWKYGVNENGPSDKTVWVLKFESLTGEPIAIVFNYGVHPVVTRREKLISGDLPGAAERYVEQQYGDKVIALFTMGPGGDQDPRIYDLPTAAQNKDQRPAAFDVMNAQGFMVGAEVVRVANEIRPTLAVVKVEADERVVSCPLKQGVKEQPYFQVGNLKREQITSVPIHLGLIMIDKIALASVSGEVSTNIYFRLKKASPLVNTIMVSMANDRTGYFVDDAAYDTPTNEVMTAPAVRGCAEDGIVNGLVDMINQQL